VPVHPFSADHGLYIGPADDRGPQLCQMEVSQYILSDPSFRSLNGLPQKLGLITEDGFRPHPLENLDWTADDGILSHDWGPWKEVDPPGDLPPLDKEMPFTEFLDLLNESSLQPSDSDSSGTEKTPVGLSLFEPYSQHRNKVIPAFPKRQMPEPCQEPGLETPRPDTDCWPTVAGASVPSPPAACGNGHGDGVGPNVDASVSATSNDLRQWLVMPAQIKGCLRPRADCL
jgi:hypothetical protein